MKVLIVDNEPEATSQVKRWLEDCNAIVMVARSSAEALERMQKERPDAIVSDIGMPGEDGHDLPAPGTGIIARNK